MPIRSIIVGMGRTMEKIDIGSAKLACKRFGSGEKTFVIDTALGTCSAEWWHIAERIGRNAQVLVYDRAGYGESSASTLERTPGKIAAELKMLLDQLRIERDITLIGHSQGGLYAVQFALQYPEMVGGLILLDPATPFDQGFRESLSTNEYKQSGVDKTSSMKIAKVITSLGLGFLLKSLLAKSPPFFYHEFAPDAKEYLLRNLCHRNTYRTALAEYAFSHSEAHTKQISEGVSSAALQNLPIKIITHASDVYVKELEAYGGMATETATKVEALWQQIMAKYLLLSRECEHVVAIHSGHYIHLTDEELLIRTVEEML